MYEEAATEWQSFKTFFMDANISAFFYLFDFHANTKAPKNVCCHAAEASFAPRENFTFTAKHVKTNSKFAMYFLCHQTALSVRRL